MSCWGINDFGQLGGGTNDSDSNVPVPVSGLTSGATALGAGQEHACAIDSLGGLKCWGDGSDVPVEVMSFLGATFDFTDDIESPNGFSLTIGADKTFTDVAAGIYSVAESVPAGWLLTSATCDDGSPVTAIDLEPGENITCTFTNAQSGSITITKEVVKVPSTTPSGTGVGAGARHTCAVLDSGGVKCWGDNTEGQLGDGTTTSSGAPVEVSGLTMDAFSVVAGDNHTCVMDHYGSVLCWGDNSRGQLGDGSNVDSTTPVAVTGLTNNVDAIAASGDHTCALTTGGGVKCWGYNAWGQLGNGTNIASNVPVDVTGLTSGVSAIATGSFHSCAGLTVGLSGGGVKCWGYNQYGQLGDGTTTDSLVPVDVLGVTNARTVAAGGLHSCVLEFGGDVTCWGRGDSGQLGNGSTANSSTPVTVSGLSGVGSIIAAGSHSCAVTTSGAAKCWGANTLGQLGNGTGVSISSPVDVIGHSSGVNALAAGAGGHTCAWVSGGGINCWGNNFQGQLGTGIPGFSLVPFNTLFESTLFDFTDDIEAPNSFSLHDGRSKTFTDLAPGLYAAAETVPTGWSLESAICEDGSPVTAIDLDPGEDLTCTFTNEDD